MAHRAGLSVSALNAGGERDRDRQGELLVEPADEPAEEGHG